MIGTRTSVIETSISCIESSMRFYNHDFCPLWHSIHAHLGKIFRSVAEVTIEYACKSAWFFRKCMCILIIEPPSEILDLPLVLVPIQCLLFLLLSCLSTRGCTGIIKCHTFLPKLHSCILLVRVSKLVFDCLLT